MSQSNYIELDNEKRFGKPIIKGARISVDNVLGWLAEGMSFDDIIYDFFELNKEQIKACLLYNSEEKQ